MRTPLEDLKAHNDSIQWFLYIHMAVVLLVILGFFALILMYILPPTLEATASIREELIYLIND